MRRPSNQPEILVVGAGIFGLAAALELRARGHDVLVIDPSEIPNPLAASTDISKVVRRGYGADEDYLTLGERAIEGWLRWNDLFGEKLFHPVGVAYFTRGPMKPESFEGMSYDLIRRHNGPAERLSQTTITRRFPAFAEGLYQDGVYVPADGYAESGRVVAKLAGIAFDQGIHIHPQTSAASLLYEMDRVVGVCTEDGDTIFADHTVVAMGAWTKLLVPQIASYVRTTGHPVFHLKPANPSRFEASRFPVWSDDATASGWYGFPLHPREGIVKIAHHGDGRVKHPALDERTVIESEDAMLRDFLQAAIPALADAPIVYRRLCLYCDTLDQHFWIDRSPHNPGLTVATGGSGHGFKFGPVLGSLIADAVEDKPNPYRRKFAWRDLPPDTRGTEGRRYRANS